MFRSFIYVNTDKVYEHYSLLDESIKEKIGMATVETLDETFKLQLHYVV